MKPFNRKTLVTSILLALPFILNECSKDHSASETQAAKDSSSTALSDTLSNSSTNPMMMSYEERQGKFYYEKYCSVCHGADGKGDGFNAFNLDPKPRDFTNKEYLGALTDAQIAETVSGGGRAVNKSPLMPSWGRRLNKRDIEYLVSYVRTFTQ